MNLFLKRNRRKVGRPQCKAHDERADQLRALAEWTLYLLDYPWGWETHSESYTELREGQTARLELERQAARLRDLGMEGPAISAWIDLAHESEPLPAVLAEAARARA